jgi:4'-phosphopantetheinyl transferase
MGQNLTLNFFDFIDKPQFPDLCELQSDAVHVWRRSLAGDPATLERVSNVLSDEERERAARYRVEHARNAFVLTRGALRLLLGAYLDQSPQSLRFQVTEYGKPFLDSELHFHFNVSHTEGLALLAFAQKRGVGVDVEKIRAQPDARKLARRFFSETERHQLENIPAPELPAAFFRCWSRKEAYIKAKGEGLSLPLHEFDVAVEIAPTEILLATRPDPREARRWLLRDVPVPPGYAAAVAVSVE